MNKNLKEIKKIYIWNNLFKDWGLGIGDWGLGIGPNPQSPIPNKLFHIYFFLIFLNFYSFVIVIKNFVQTKKYISHIFTLLILQLDKI